MSAAGPTRLILAQMGYEPEEIEALSPDKVRDLLRHYRASLFASVAFPSEPLAAALFFASVGWPVFPVNSAAEKKHPFTENGWRDASTEEARLRSWRRWQPACGWGIPTGRQSDILVLDVDGAAGKASLRELCERHKDTPFPETLTAISGSGEGLHYYFLMPDVPEGVRCSAGRVGVGLDVRGDAGSIVAPPSPHKSGNTYQWLNWGTPLALPPSWLVAYAMRQPSRQDARQAERQATEAREKWKSSAADERKRKYAEAALDGALREIEGAREGTRNHTLNAEVYAIGQLVGSGFIDRDVADKNLRAAALRAGLKADEIESVVPHALVDGINNPRYPNFEPERQRTPRREDGPVPRPEDYGETVDGSVVSIAAHPDYHGAADGGEDAPVDTIPVLPLETPIPPRRWLLGKTFCRANVSGIIGVGSAGKTSLRLVQALCVATGRDLLGSGDKVHERAKVLYVGLEDSIDEMQRRVRAAMLHHDVAEEEIAGYFELYRPTGEKKLLAILDPRGKVLPGPLYRALSWLLRERGFALVILDPLIGCHELDEGDNSQMARLIEMLAELATEGEAAVDFCHHTRKGGGLNMDPADVERARGAGAIIFQSRLIQMFSVMTRAEAEEGQVSESERRRYVRLDDGKLNIAVASGEARWFHLASVELANGDNVQAAEPWKMPVAARALTKPQAVAILDTLARGFGDGRLYSDARNASERAAHIVIERLSDLTRKQAYLLLKDWRAHGVIDDIEYYDETAKRSRKGLRVNIAKRNEIAAGLPAAASSEPPEPDDLL